MADAKAPSNVEELARRPVPDEGKAAKKRPDNPDARVERKLLESEGESGRGGGSPASDIEARDERAHRKSSRSNDGDIDSSCRSGSSGLDLFEERLRNKANRGSYLEAERQRAREEAIRRKGWREGDGDDGSGEESGGGRSLSGAAAAAASDANGDRRVSGLDLFEERLRDKANRGSYLELEQRRRESGRSGEGGGDDFLENDDVEIDGRRGGAAAEQDNGARRNPIRADSGQESRKSSQKSVISNAESVAGHPKASTPHIPEAYLVTGFTEEGGEPAELPGEVVMAERVSFSEKKWKTMLLATCALMVLMAVVLSVFLAAVDGDAKEAEAQVGSGTALDGYCTPCMNRTEYTIRVVARHGDSAVDKFGPAARRAARDLGVNLEMEFYARENGVRRAEQIAVDILAAAEPGSGVDALIVTDLSKAVVSAVHTAVEAEVPVFGVEARFKAEGLVQDGSLRFATGMYDRWGGVTAANYFLQKIPRANYAKALFVSYVPSRYSNAGYQRRYKGYHNRLVEASNSTIEAEWMEVQPPIPKRLMEKLSGCAYQSVLIGSGRLVKAVSDAIRDNGCDGIKVGSFEPDHVPKEYLTTGVVDFVIDQFHQLQGWAAVLFAALYITTGQVIAPPPGGVHISGPVLLTKENFTSLDGSGDCEEEEDGDCIDRRDVTIGGVVHGTAGDEFWDAVYSAANQSAVDMGVHLAFDRFAPRESNEALYEEMAAKVLSLCASGVDGLFVSLPDERVVDAVRDCEDSNPNVRIISINAGYDESKELGLIHHIGMVERDAGREAGKEMAAKAPALNKVLCFNHDPGLRATNDRCVGFEEAVHNLGIEYLGKVEMLEADASSFTSAVESSVGRPGDWDGYGILLTGLSWLPAALELKRLHPGLVLGAFDTDGLLYESLASGKVLFGVDQQPYLQGYLPVSILTNAITTDQFFLDHSIASGPRFVFEPPTDVEVACEKRNFPVCSGQEK